MGAEAKDPKQIVKDGVDGDTGAVPRQSARGTAGPPSGPEAERNTGDGAPGGTGEVPGPAEEQDAQTHDDRGLTTETNPD